MQETNNATEQLVEAARIGDLKGVMCAIDEGASINSRVFCDMQQSITALLEAVSNNHVDIAEYLLEIGADPDIRNDFKATALHQAVKQGSLACVHCLLKHNADQSVKDLNGNTPVHLAIIYNQPDILKHLLSIEGVADRYRNNPDLFNNSGFALTHLAAKHGAVECMRYLIEAGCDLDLKAGAGAEWYTQCNPGSTALDMATIYQHDEIISLINSYRQATNEDEVLNTVIPENCPAEDRLRF